MNRYVTHCYPNIWISRFFILFLLPLIVPIIVFEKFAGLTSTCRSGSGTYLFLLQFSVALNSDTYYTLMEKKLRNLNICVSGQLLRQRKEKRVLSLPHSRGSIWNNFVKRNWIGIIFNGFANRTPVPLYYTHVYRLWDYYYHYFIGNSSLMRIHVIGMIPIDEKNVDMKNNTIFIHDETGDEGQKLPMAPIDR